MSTLPSTGPLSVSAVRTLFGSSFKQLSLHRGIALGVPSTGVISLSQLRGKAPSVPSVSTITTLNVDTGSTAQSGSLNLASYVTDTYGGTLTYSAPSYTGAAFTTCSVSGTTLSYSHPLNKFANASATITVTNRFGKTATITVPFLVVGYAIATSTPGSSSLTTNTATYTLSSYFTDYSGAGLTHTITSNPYSNASITSGVLSVVGNRRNVTYNIIVQASNSYGQAGTISVPITELPAAPAGSIPSLSITSSATLNLSTYISNATSYSIISNPYSNASISGSTINVNFAFRGTTYNIMINAVGPGGNTGFTLQVQESKCYDCTGAYNYTYFKTSPNNNAGTGTMTMNPWTGVGTINGTITLNGSGSTFTSGTPYNDTGAFYPTGSATGNYRMVWGTTVWDIR